MDEWITLITNVGFPIAMCLLLWYTCTKDNKTMRTAIDNNTAALMDLKSELKRGKDK